MTNALNKLRKIDRAKVSVTIRPALALFIRGPLRAHRQALDALWREVLLSCESLEHLSHHQGPGDVQWQALRNQRPHAVFSDAFAQDGPVHVSRRLAFAAEGGAQRRAASVEFNDLAPALGMERASSIRLLWDRDAPVTEMTAIAHWAVQHLPLWWGCGGHVFHHTSGTWERAGARMATLAKRYWSVQVQDMTRLQWDALQGMPGIDWLTLIGKEFAAQRKVDLAALAGQLLPMAHADSPIFHRAGPWGLAIAAGPRPVTGDINMHQDLDALSRIDHLLRPLIMEELPPQSGPLGRPEVRLAWSHRFVSPQGWLDCDVSAG